MSYYSYYHYLFCVKITLLEARRGGIAFQWVMLSLFKEMIVVQFQLFFKLTIESVFLHVSSKYPTVDLKKSY